jgi:hypothetical protein
MPGFYLKNGPANTCSVVGGVRAPYEYRALWPAFPSLGVPIPFIFYLPIPNIFTVDSAYILRVHVYVHIFNTYVCVWILDVPLGHCGLRHSTGRPTRYIIISYVLLPRRIDLHGSTQIGIRSRVFCYTPLQSAYLIIGVHTVKQHISRVLHAKLCACPVRDISIFQSQRRDFLQMGRVCTTFLRRS